MKEVYFDDVIDNVDEDFNQEITVNIEVKHDFTEDELAEMAQTIVESGKVIDELDSEIETLKYHASLKKKEVEAIDKEWRDVARKYRQGFEMKSVTCRIVDNYDTGTREYVSINTDEVVKSEQLKGLFQQNGTA